MSVSASVVLVVSLVGSIWGEFSPLSRALVENRPVLTAETCPKDLSALQGQIEELLPSVSNESFKKATRSSLTASIPEAIQQADGINPQIAFLRKEIALQAQVKSDAAEIAKESSDKPSGSLLPCEPDEKGSYCSAVEQYYISSVSLLANSAFLDALECYKRNGMK